MARDLAYFSLDLESLRAVAGWAADCAERVLPLYEGLAGTDSRPRDAITGSREFAAGGRRTAQLRFLAVSALAAARESADPAAAAAARAAGLAAASAYTHPLVDVRQTKHILGPAAYAALALELHNGGAAQASEAEVRRAIEQVTPAVREVLLQMPARAPGRTRLDQLLHALDQGVRTASRPLRMSTQAL